jgi:hypothetical protein
MTNIIELPRRARQLEWLQHRDRIWSSPVNTWSQHDFELFTQFCQIEVMRRKKLGLLTLEEKP